MCELDNMADLEKLISDLQRQNEMLTYACRNTKMLLERTMKMVGYSEDNNSEWLGPQLHRILDDLKQAGI